MDRHSNAGAGTPDHSGGEQPETQWSEDSTAVYVPEARRDERLAWVHGQTVDGVFDRARETGACLPTEFIFSLYAQSCAELAGVGRRPARYREDRHLEPELCPGRIFVQFDGQVLIDWSQRDPVQASYERARCYLSPEHLRGLPTNGRSDLYSLALAMAELFVLKRLSDGRGSITASEGGADFAELLRSGARVPRELGSMLLKSLALDVEQRPFGVTSLLEDLERLGQKLGLRAHPSITATYMRSLFIEAPGPTDHRSYGEPSQGREGSVDPDTKTWSHAHPLGDLNVFDDLSSPVPPAPPTQLLPPPIELEPRPPEPRRPTTSPPQRATPHATRAPAAGRIAGHPPESEVPPALARTLPPEQSLQKAARSGPSREPTGSFGRRAMILVAAALTGVVVFPFVKGGPSRMFTAAAGHWGEPLSNAVMTVDGDQKCTGARCTFEVAPGVHEVIARADGYAPQVQLIAVRSREPAALNFRLERGGSAVKISGQPAGSTVVVDGEQAGRLPLEVELAPGAHRLRVEAEHFVADEREIQLALGETLRVEDIALRPNGDKVTDKMACDPRALAEGAPPTEKKVARARPVAAAPPRANPSVNPNSPDALRAAMQRVVERDTSTKGSWDEDSGDPSAASSDPCIVTFNTLPPSTVFVDNVRVGMTPILKTHIKAGSHVVQFVEGDSKKVKPFVCKPGENKVIALSLNR